MMLTFWQTIVLAAVTGVLSGTVTGSIFTYFFNKRLDRRQRVMEMRRKIYTDIHEELAGFFNTANAVDRQMSGKLLLSSFRKVQLWGSDNVTKQFNRLIYVMDLKNARPQEEMDREYKKLIVEMRKDLTGESANEEDIQVYGRIN